MRSFVRRFVCPATFLFTHTPTNHHPHTQTQLKTESSKAPLSYCRPLHPLCRRIHSSEKDNPYDRLLTRTRWSDRLLVHSIEWVVSGRHTLGRTSVYTQKWLQFGSIACRRLLVSPPSLAASRSIRCAYQFRTCAASAVLSVLTPPAVRLTKTHGSRSGPERVAAKPSSSPPKPTVSCV